MSRFSAEAPSGETEKPAVIGKVHDKLKELEEHIFKEGPKIARELDLTDIAAKPADFGEKDQKLNPQYGIFGKFQEPFYKALSEEVVDESGTPTERVNTSGDWFHETPEVDGIKWGYYISEVSIAEAGINLEDPKYTNIRAITEALEQFSLKKAMERFVKLGLSLEDVRKHISFVHRILKVDPTTKKVEKYYGFWTMPTKVEWQDIQDPSAYKERAPFE